MSHPSLPWYQDGLHFSCTQCGKCCTGTTGSVEINEEEIEQMAQFLHLSIKNFKKLYIKKRNNKSLLVEKKSPSGFDCIFFQNNQCAVYKARPLQCRLYPFWPENLLTPKAWEQTASFCEGICASGSLFTQNEIDQMKAAQIQANEHYVPNEN
jgi:Fe-S-cluster containining protein